MRTGVPGTASLQFVARGGISTAQLRGVRSKVARRAGRGVAVLLKIYAHCIDGQADAANHQRITDALGMESRGLRSADL
jgi:hypothetical protein